MTPCLASTGATPWWWLTLAASLGALGVVLWRRSRRAFTLGVLLVALTTLTSSATPAHATCAVTTTTTSSAPLSGTITIDQSGLTVVAAPTVTATDGTTTVTANVGAPTSTPQNTSFPFSFPTLAAGSWTLEATLPPTVSVILAASSIPLTVIADATTSGAFDAVTSAPLAIGSSPVTVTLEVTPSN